MPTLDNVQPKEDVKLKTKEKTIVGAINEVNEKVEAQDTEALRKKLEEIEQLAAAGIVL
jgi:mitochondrial fission protein ELM1